MEKGLTKKFWAALAVFGLMGQVAWVVENMYFNVFLYKMFHASAADISLMVGASSVAATITTILVGAFTDYIGKRKIFICGGYMAWGISILSFAFIRMDLLTPVAGSTIQAASLGITLVIVMDCVMTFLGSSANDACFNAWMTDWGDGSNRGKIEGINSMMPLAAILVVFGGFSAFDLDRAESWTIIYLIVGLIVLVIGILGFFLIEECKGLAGESACGIAGEGRKAGEEVEESAVWRSSNTVRRDKGSQVKEPNAESVTTDSGSFGQNLIYSFRPSVIGRNPLLYAVIGAFAVFGISINIFMPYLILYYEKTLGMENYVMIMAPAIVLAAVITAFYGKLFDLMGFKFSVVPAIFLLMAGYVMLYLCRGTVAVFIGSLLMMTGYLTGMAVFGAMIRSHIPEKKAGQFQGIRIIGQVLIPGIVGPAIGAAVLHNAEQIVNADGTTSFLPNGNIYMAALAAAVLLFMVLYLIFRMMRDSHNRLISRWGEELMGLQCCAEEQTKSVLKCGVGLEKHWVWGGYPRPQMRRESFISLNGTWRLNGQDILVPFPPQSLLAGYKGHVGANLEYSRDFMLHLAERGSRLLLHFGAVDQVAEIYVNGGFVGKHEGGYLPFYFDVTDYVKEGSNSILVKARDTLSPMYPYGKQLKNRGGMWYTPVSGIWQSVWMEWVPGQYIEKLNVTADLSKVCVGVERGGTNGGKDGQNETAQENKGIRVSVTLHDGTIHTVSAEGNQVEIDLANIRLSDGTKYCPSLWTPEHPYLYEMTVEVGEDTVSSYFGLRTIEVKKIQGLPRVCLNGVPIFLHGVLDQGYFCDGIYLPASEEAYQQDILQMKELGLNLLRKHIKIEPECFYYYCDLHGMLVMQDMVNSGVYSWIKDTALPTLGVYQRGNGKLWGRKKRRDFFIGSMQETISHLHNHPCVAAYTIFNEGWGQFDSDAMYELAKRQDGTRLYDATSGWFHGRKSDFDSQHIYFKPLQIPPIPEKPVLVSECGGYSYRVPHHFFARFTRFGYGDCGDEAELTGCIRKLYEQIILTSIPKGVSGCVYTQLSDVEDETNGFYTYDRKVCKVDKAAMREIAGRLFGALSEHAGEEEQR